MTDGLELNTFLTERLFPELCIAYLQKKGHSSKRQQVNVNIERGNRRRNPLRVAPSLPTCSPPPRSGRTLLLGSSAPSSLWTRCRTGPPPADMDPKAAAPSLHAQLLLLKNLPPGPFTFIFRAFSRRFIQSHLQ